ncbi:hypothetical protein LUX33_49490 [Actinomadura madurae]|uniref:hypothetical protein n=1 Tax=Actinomadura madurae TaxID=1993 RepID=UPI0020D24AE2|nr:hypothetical protein [Actinomadura madurae]MCP9955600.1 hypothetical protein [Actinomadura madurae]
MVTAASSSPSDGRIRRHAEAASTCVRRSPAASVTLAPGRQDRHLERAAHRLVDVRARGARVGIGREGHDMLGMRADEAADLAQGEDGVTAEFGRHADHDDGSQVTEPDALCAGPGGDVGPAAGGVGQQVGEQVAADALLGLDHGLLLEVEQRGDLCGAFGGPQLDGAERDLALLQQQGSERRRPGDDRHHEGASSHGDATSALAASIHGLA